MVHFPQITLREWIHPFLRVMKRIKCEQSGQNVCEVERTFFINLVNVSAAVCL